MIRGEGHDLAAVGKSLNAIGGQKTLSVQCRDIHSVRIVLADELAAGLARPWERA